MPSNAVELALESLPKSIETYRETAPMLGNKPRDVKLPSRSGRRVAGYGRRQCRSREWRLVSPGATRTSGSSPGRAEPPASKAPESSWARMRAGAGASGRSLPRLQVRLNI